MENEIERLSINMFTHKNLNRHGSRTYVFIDEEGVWINTAPEAIGESEMFFAWEDVLRYKKENEDARAQDDLSDAEWEEDKLLITG